MAIDPISMRRAPRKDADSLKQTPRAKRLQPELLARPHCVPDPLLS
jgi:hypothetical protein